MPNNERRNQTIRVLTWVVWSLFALSSLFLCIYRPPKYVLEINPVTHILRPENQNSGFFLAYRVFLDTLVNRMHEAMQSRRIKLKEDWRISVRLNEFSRHHPGPCINIEIEPTKGGQKISVYHLRLDPEKTIPVREAEIAAEIIIKFLNNPGVVRPDLAFRRVWFYIDLGRPNLLYQNDR